MYADGELVGEVGDLKDCPLPMQRVGDAERALHGLLVEVRYWATARSKAEINKLRNSLLPEDAQGRARGVVHVRREGRFVNDVSGQRYRRRSRLARHQVGGALAATDGDEPPTPASRERSCCKVELRRARLAAKGRENFQLVECELNCGAPPMMRINLRHHRRFECGLRYTQCKMCAMRLPMRALAEHEREECPVVHERWRLAKQFEVGDREVECELCGQMVRKRTSSATTGASASSGSSTARTTAA